MLSFHGDQNIKDKYIARVKAHAAADEIRKGVYWENGKGCAVGCTIHSREHAAYETELGIPEEIARLEDGIFEGLPNKIAKKFPLRFLTAIPVGVDLSKVLHQFMHWLLVGEEYGVLQFADKNGKIDINNVAELLKRTIDGEKVDLETWKAATDVASATARAHAASNAINAAHAAARAAIYAASGAGYAAATATAYAYGAAAGSAANAAAFNAAAFNVGAKHRVAQADKLIELLEGAGK